MFHERLETLRKKSGLSQAETARRLGIPRTTYSGYALGTREPDLETINMFANHFNVSVNFLVSGGEGGEFEKRINAMVEDFVSLSEEDQDHILSLVKRMKKSSY